MAKQFNPCQADDVQQHIAEAEALANVQADTDYNIVKYDSKSQSLSLLWYPGFFDEAFPALAKSYRINLDTRRVEKRNYQASLNPPILHRKELFISHVGRAMLFCPTFICVKMSDNDKTVARPTWFHCH